jgi:hypothetical protein
MDEFKICGSCEYGRPVLSLGMCSACYQRDYARRYKEKHGRPVKKRYSEFSPEQRAKALEYSKDWQKRNRKKMREYDNARSKTDRRKGWKKKYTASEEYKERRRKNNSRWWKSHLRGYGMTQESLDLLWSKQDGKCAICGADLADCKSRRQAHIDHDHSTGKVRGILCGNCNRGLGSFNDSSDKLRSAIAYLSRHRQEVPYLEDSVVVLGIQ